VQKFTKNEKDIVIMSLLASHRRIAALTDAYVGLKSFRKSKKLESFKRVDNKYFFADLPICRKMFLFLHDMGKAQFENLIKHFDKNGIVFSIYYDHLFQGLVFIFIVSLSIFSRIYVSHS